MDRTCPCPHGQFLYDGDVTTVVYAAGGSYGGYNDQLIRYDPQTDEWETRALSMPRRFMSSGVIDGKFTIEEDGSTQLDSMEIYDPATNSWIWVRLWQGKSTRHARGRNGKILFVRMVKDKLTRSLSSIHRASSSIIATLPSTRSQHRRWFGAIKYTS